MRYPDEVSFLAVARRNGPGMMKDWGQPRLKWISELTQKFLLLLQSNAATGKEAAYHDWYENRHIPDLLAVPGIVSAQRYAVSPLQQLQPGSFQYVALYEIETDDLALTMATIRERSGTDLMPMSDTIAPDRIALFLEPIGQKRKAQRPDL